ncbi:MAG: helix-turn-helix domain-containing protein, partial [Desulfurococcaceae archaeon]
MLRPKEVCEKLGISYTTLREYVRRGWIKPVVLESGKWRFREEDVEKLMGIVKPKTVILYARVSSHAQKDDLERQVMVLEEWAKQNNVVDYKVITDIGSGLNED